MSWFDEKRRIAAEFDKVKKLEQRIEQLEDKLNLINNWCKAYPIKAFPEPDFEAVADCLKTYGMSLDAVSASNMRHVVRGIRRIIEGEPETAIHIEDYP